MVYAALSVVLTDSVAQKKGKKDGKEVYQGPSSQKVGR